MAAKVFITTLVVGAIGFASLTVGGIVDIIGNALAPSQIRILGAELSMGIVGVALACLAAVALYFTVKTLIKMLVIVNQRW